MFCQGETLWHLIVRSILDRFPIKYFDIYIIGITRKKSVITWVWLLKPVSFFSFCDQVGVHVARAS